MLTYQLLCENTAEDREKMISTQIHTHLGKSWERKFKNIQIFIMTVRRTQGIDFLLISFTQFPSYGCYHSILNMYCFIASNVLKR